MKRLLRLCGARLRCWWYLLCRGLWSGECEMRCWDKDRRLCFIAAATGSMFDGTLKVTRVFYRDDKTIIFPEDKNVPS